MTTPPALTAAIKEAGFMTAAEVDEFLGFRNKKTARQLRLRHLKGLGIEMGTLYLTAAVESSDRAIRNGWKKKGKVK